MDVDKSEKTGNGEFRIRNMQKLHFFDGVQLINSLVCETQ